jgi:hypothetical protein
LENDCVDEDKVARAEDARALVVAVAGAAAAFLDGE